MSKDPRRFVPLDAEQKALVEQHLPYAKWMAGDRFRPGEDIDDLLEACYEGLVRAAQTWDGSKASFKTYAYYAMVSKIVQNRWANRRGGLGKSHSFRNARELMPACFGGCASELPIGDRRSVRWDFGEDTEEILSCLTPRMRRVVEMYFFQGMLNREIGQAEGVTRSRAHQILHKALEKIRERMIELGLNN